MPWALILLAVCSGSAFLFYGYETLTMERQTSEFERYGLPGLRQFVGVSQLLGGAGVFAGLVFTPIGAAAAAGLTIMMASGLAVRVKIHDAWRLMIPAASLGAVNATLTVLFLLR